MVYLGVAGLLIALAFLLDEATQGIIYILIGLTATVAGPIGIARHRPEISRPWVLFSTGAGLFVGSAIVRAAHGAIVGVVDPFPSPADILGLSAYLVSFLGAQALLHSRSRRTTRSLNLDAGMITLGLGTFVWVYVMGPHITDVAVPVAERVFNAAYSLGDLMLAFMVVRIALTPGRRPRAYYILAAGASATLIADTLIILDIAGIFSFPGRIAFAAIPLALLAAAALDGTMTQLTEEVADPAETLTPKRLALMGLAILLPPVLLLVQDLRGAGSLLPMIVAVWAGVSMLAMARLAELIRARERDVTRQDILLAADEALVAATDRGAILRAAIDTMEALLSEPESCRLGVALVVDGDLVVEVVKGVEAERAMGSRVSLSDLSSLGVDLATSQCSVITSEIDLPGVEVGWVTITPLLSQQEVVGVLMVASPTAPSRMLIEASPSLATDVALALDAARLTEEIHRQRSERQFRSLVEQGSDVVAVLDENLALTFVSAAAERLLERPISELTGVNIVELAHEDDRPTLETLISSARMGSHAGRSVGPAEIRLLDVFGQVHTVEIVITDLSRDDVVAGIVINAHDVTDRKALEESLRHQALHDNLTGLGNRFMFQQRVNHALLRRSTIERVVGVLFLDLDDFKTVNDSLGPRSETSCCAWSQNG